MAFNLKQEINELNQKHYKKRKYNLIITFFMVLVFVSTAIFFNQPAQTIADELACEHIEHVHDESCYINDYLFCNKEEHQHLSVCYRENIPAELENVAGFVNVSPYHSAKAKAMSIAKESEPRYVLLNDYEYSYFIYYGEGANKKVLNEGDTISGDERISIDFSYLIKDAAVIKKIHDYPGPNDDDKNIAYFELPDILRDLSCGSDIVQGTTKIGSVEVLISDEHQYYLKIRFNDDWIDNLLSNPHGDVTGSLTASGRIDPNKVEDNKITIPKKDGDLTVKVDDSYLYQMSDVEINKTFSESKIVSDADGNQYWEYQLRVSVPNDSTFVNKDIVVIDRFMHNLAYCSGYVGVTREEKVLDSNNPAIAPVELIGHNSIENYTAEHGKVYLAKLNYDKDNEITSTIPGPAQPNEGLGAYNLGEMVWVIGDMKPGENRILTYRVKMSDDFYASITNGSQNGPTNEARVYSGQYHKDDSSLAYQDNINWGKDENDRILHQKNVTTVTNDDGSLDFNYKIEIGMDSKNDFALPNFKIYDSLFINGTDEVIKPYISVKDFKLVKNYQDEEKTIDYANLNPTGTNPKIYDDQSFDFYFGRMEPGAKYTLTYTLHIDKNLFTQVNEEIKVNNRFISYAAAGNKVNSTQFDAWSCNKTIGRYSWSSKLADQIATSENLDINMNDGQTFHVPKGSYKYDVVVNKQLGFDLSMSTFKDELGNALAYAGYARLVSVDKNIFNYLNINCTDQELANYINDLIDRDQWESNKNNFNGHCVYFDINNKTEFEVIPKNLGLPSGENVYILTYYTYLTKDVSNFAMSNDFILSGQVGNNNFAPGGLKINKTFTVIGSNPFTIKKGSMRYQQPSANTYKNGDLYWYFELSGNVRAGLQIDDITSGHNNIQSWDLSFLFHDSSVVGLYHGSLPNGLVMSDFVNMDDFNKRSTLTKYSEDYYSSQVIEENKNMIITLNKDLELDDNEKAYLIIKTEPRYLVFNQGAHDIKTFTNSYQYRSNQDDTWIEGNEKAQQTISKNESSFKYTARILKRDDVGGWKKLYQDKYLDKEEIFDVNGTLYPNYILTDRISKPGIYYEWTINVNWDGLMSGTVDISDYLPQGVELTYLRYYNAGSDYYNSSLGFKVPTCQVIEECDNDGDWKKYEITANSRDHNDLTSIYYYNEKTNEIKLKVDGIQRGGNISKNTQDYNGALSSRYVQFQVVAKVTTPDILLNPEGSELTNKIKVTDQNGYNIEDDVTTAVGNSSIDKHKFNYEAIDASKYYFKIPFEIIINKDGEDLDGNSDKLILIDELSSNMTFLEDTLVIKNTKTNQELTHNDYKIAMEQRDDGGWNISLTLPDNQPLNIYYEARINSKIGEAVQISNKAHWNSYPSDESSIVEDKYQQDVIAGTVDVQDTPVFTLKKVDRNDLSLLLSGAKFKLESGNINNQNEFVSDGNLNVELVTGTDGTVKYPADNNETNKLQFDQVYRLTEIQAPNGYLINSQPFYFVVAKGTKDENGNTVYKHYSDLVYVFKDEIDVSYTFTNQKGKILLNKLYQNESGVGIPHPTHGKVSFGLYTQANPTSDTTPLQRLDIVYNGNEITYYRDGISTVRPEFNDLLIGSGHRYFIYELDSNDQPVTQNNSFITLDHGTYIIRYTVNDGIEIPQNSYETSDFTYKLVNEVTYKLPATGGHTTASYYFAASSIMVGLLIYLKQRTNKKNYLKRGGRKL